MARTVQGMAVAINTGEELVDLENQDGDTHPSRPSLLAVVRHWGSDLQRNGLMRCLQHNMLFLAILGMVALYFVVGIAFYSTTEKWTVLESIYFVVVMTTTVGYGDLSPTKESSQVFTFFYAIAGIALFTFLLSVQIRFITSQPSDEAANQRVQAMLASLGDDEQVPGPRLPKSMEPSVKGVFLRIFGGLVVLLFVGIVFSVTALGHTFVEAMYFALITATGIGFGDLVPSRDSDGRKSIGGMWFGIIFILLSFVWLFYVLEQLTTLLRQKDFHRQVMATINRDLTAAIMSHADTDNNGVVDKAEWIIMMLLLNRVCSPKMISLMLQRFDELDVDQSGALSRDDIIVATSTNPTLRKEATIKRASRRRRTVLRKASAVGGFQQAGAANAAAHAKEASGPGLEEPLFEERFEVSDSTLKHRTLFRPEQGGSEDTPSMADTNADSATPAAAAGVQLELPGQPRAGQNPTPTSAPDKLDLRKLTRKEAEDMLMAEHGVPRDTVKAASRWELISMLRRVTEGEPAAPSEADEETAGLIHINRTVVDHL